MNITLAFGGGGLRCAAQIGVLRTVQQRGITINAGAGTSFGSVVIGLYAMGVDLDYIEEIFVSGELMRAFLPRSVQVQLMLMPFARVLRYIRREEQMGLFTGRSFQDYLNKCVGNRRIEQARFPLGIVVTDLGTQKTRCVSAGDFGQAVQASCAVPGLFCPVRLDGSLCVDGGTTENLPVRTAKSLGRATKVIAVNVDPDTAMRDGISALQFVDRLLSTHLASIDRTQADMADLVIRPEHGVPGWLSRCKDEALMRMAIESGRVAAERALTAPCLRQPLRRPLEHAA